MFVAVVAVVAAAGCGADDQVDVDAQVVADGAQVTDAGLDGDPPPVPMCTVGASTAAPPGTVPPVAGSYCATWTRVDGQQDPFARYYDRADVTLGAAPGVRWWSSGSAGAKEYVAGAALAGNCLAVDPFVTLDGYSGSDAVVLCWSAPGAASGGIGWCAAGLSDAHWTVQLTACP